MWLFGCFVTFISLFRERQLYQALLAFPSIFCFFVILMFLDACAYLCIEIKIDIKIESRVMMSRLFLYLPTRGFLVQRSIRGRAAEMGRKVSLRV